MEIVKSDDMVVYIGAHKQLREDEQLDDCFFSLFCTDSVLFWIIQQTETDFKTVYEALNPSLEAPSSRILKHVTDCLKSKSFTFKKYQKDNRSLLSLKINSNLARLPFRWHSDLPPASPVIIQQIFTAPLLGLCCELQRRQNVLFSNYKHKDKELKKFALNQGVRLFPNNNFPDHETLEAFENTMNSDEEALRKSINCGLDIFSNPKSVSVLTSFTAQSSVDSSTLSSSPSLSLKTDQSPETKPSKSTEELEKERRLELKKKLETNDIKQKPKKKKKGFF